MLIVSPSAPTIQLYAVDAIWRPTQVTKCDRRQLASKIWGYKVFIRSMISLGFPLLPYSGKFLQAQIFVNHRQTCQVKNFAIFGPLPKTPSGNKYTMTVTDYFSKWSEAKAIPTKEAHQ